jgi:hypothetical protein
MASLGTLAVNIVARTENFTSGITKSVNSMAAFNKRITGTTKLVAGFIAASAGFAGISAFKSAGEDLDDMAKKAAGLGIATEKLAGLRHAASLSGVEFNKLNVSLTTMTRLISQAATTGKGSAVGVLEELGLNAATLNRLTPDQQLGKIADALSGVTNNADKVRIAYTLFGKSGVGLINVLADGSAGLNRMQKDAEALGIAFNSEQIGRVEAMNDALSRLSEAMGVFGQGLLIDIAPAATFAIDALTEAVQGLQGMRGAGLNEDGTPMKAGERKNQALTLGLFSDEAVKNDAAYFAPLFENDQIGQLTPEEQAAHEKRLAASLALEKSGGLAAAQDSLAIGQNQQEQVGALSHRFGKMLGAAFTTSNAQALLDPVASGLATSFTAVSEKIAADADLMKRAKEVSDSLMTPAERVAEQMKEIDTLVSGGALDAAKGAELKKRLGEDTAATVGPRQELTARTAGDIDTYAAARRNLGDGSKTQIDIAKKQLKEQQRTRELLAKRGAPPVFTLGGVG